MVIKTYVAGLGKIAFGVGKDHTETPVLEITEIANESQKIGSDVTSEIKNTTLIFFKNLEGLEVLEGAIKVIKKQLKNQQKCK